MSAEAPFLIVAILASSVAVGAVLWARARSSGARELLIARETELVRELSALDEQRRDQLTAQRHLHEEDNVRAEARHAAVVSDLRASFDSDLARQKTVGEQQRRRVDALLAYGRAALQWDQSARRDIIDLLEDARISALVATNVMFLVDEGERSFVAQIDHAIFTRHAAFIVEGKHWTGVTFDGILPQTLYPDLARIFLLENLAAPFSLNLTRSSPTTITIRTQSGPSTNAPHARPPRSQARTQAVRLRTALASAGCHVDWISPVVYYSHHDGVLHAAPVADGERTPAVGSKEDLQRWIVSTLKRARSDTPALNLDALAKPLAAWGGALDGTGEYVRRWASPI